MILGISHQTAYRYSKPVFLEPQYLSFYPHRRSHIDIQEFSMDVIPVPAGRFSFDNLEQNRIVQCWFNGSSEELKIEVSMQIETREFNPFGFFIDRNRVRSEHYDHFPYTRLEEELSDEMKSLMQDFKGGALEDPLGPLNFLLNYLHNNYGHQARYEEHIHTPTECFTMKDVSCRDISWMMVNMLRWLGLPSRFVSGYAFNPELGEGHELHAWVEVLIPGAGWVGLDPSAGVFTDNKYIPVAASYRPRDTMPVIGTYRGDASAKLSTKVKINQM